MTYTLEFAKRFTGAIVQVTKQNNKLLMYEAKDLLVPKKIIRIEHLKSIDFIINYGNYQASYITIFNYNDKNVDRMEWVYKAYGHDWEDETVKLINKAIELV